jgi:hypothetical protein
LLTSCVCFKPRNKAWFLCPIKSDQWLGKVHAHHKQDFLACLFVLSLETRTKKMTWKDIMWNHISRRHNTCNQCLSFHV